MSILEQGRLFEDGFDYLQKHVFAINRKCIICGREFCTPYDRRLVCPNADCYRTYIKGPNFQQISWSSGWRQRWKCNDCGRRRLDGTRLECHHIDKRRPTLGDEYPEDVESLCTRCHLKKEGYPVKGK